MQTVMQTAEPQFEPVKRNRPKKLFHRPERHQRKLQSPGVRKLQSQAKAPVMQGFDCTYVDLRLPNKQKRLNLLVQAVSKTAAIEAFNTKMGPNYKAIQVEPVDMTLKPGALEALVTVFSSRKAA